MGFLANLCQSPALYPLGFDPKADVVLFIRLTEAEYVAASFLDLRMVPPGTKGEWKPWAEVRETARGLPARCHFIFHISHVGSTLLARLLGQHARLFSLREPVVLRKLADIHSTLGEADCPMNRDAFEERLGVFLGLWSRTFRPEQTAMIKATSFVCEMSAHLLQRTPDSRAVFMTVSPLTFLKSLLDGAMSDIDDHAAKRLRRLQRRLGDSQWRIEDLSPGESVAMSWLCEVLALRAAAAQSPGRVLWIDFDRFLEQPNMSLLSAFRHLDVDVNTGEVDGILAGPTMGRYAKAPAHAFSAQMRQQLQEQAEFKHAIEIRKGLDWLDRTAAKHPAVRKALTENRS